ncbi:hypothetical protein OIDMADRAFT_56552 [Oidiodendron maius Zn]|uniref:NACHT domain-containing protein n=1 Tax=Oidiodendron maius (strain Zn) TaxID=913774 RepID=A0A0C3CKA2_OIDMZ|nr:hypothetical protein OIDMADRAFT_56552 [Oidiodendron maius Zn]
MRLLKHSDTGEFNFTKDFVGDDRIPPYAILSHTWGLDTDEVVFEDLINGTGRDKAGFKKIRFCGKQARQDGLQYFWIDTCCINKANYTELSQAINSMFRWYQNAAKCYVYLSDVLTTERKASDQSSEFTWKLAFQESRWFKRGWTLQELLAPITVEFFSQECQRLGDKKSLRQMIHEITGIANLALQGANLSQFSVEERLSWIDRRQTKLEEDKAYSLLGIFDISMPLIYGEGGQKAFKRLREEIDKHVKGLLQRLAPAQQKNEDQECIQHLRLTDPRDDKKRIEETKGGLLEDSYHWILENPDFQEWRNDEQNCLLWIRGDPGKGKTMLLCGIIDELEKSIAKTDLVSYFFCQATDSRINSATAVLRGLLFLLVNQKTSLVSHIRKKHDYAGKSLFEDVNSWSALTEIFTNILHDLSLNNTYIIIDALDECIEDMPKLLDFIVQKSSISPCIKWIVSSRNWPDIEELLEMDGHKVLASIAIVYRPITLQELTSLVEILEDMFNDLESLREIIGLCGSFLTIRGDVIYFIHQSVQDYIFKEAFDKIFPSGKGEAHYTIFSRSLQVTSRTVQRDIYNLRAPGFPIDQVKQPELDPLAAVRYSCIHWTDHLCACSGNARQVNDLRDGGAVDYFIRRKYLYWLEALSLCRSMSEGVISMAKLEALIEDRSDASTLIELVRDARRFIMYHKWAIEHNPLQAYIYALLFSPACSLTRCLFMEEEPKWIIIKPAMRNKWNACLQTFEGHKTAVMSAAFTHNSTRLASASWDGTVKIWDINSGECIQTLGGDDAKAQSITFSHDSTRLTSASGDDTIKIWDTGSYKCLQTLRGHNASVTSIAFSHDSTWLVSASDDNTVKVWDMNSYQCLQTLEGHKTAVMSAAFTHNSTRLASASSDGTVKIWDIISGECLQTLKGHGAVVWSVAFSHDSTRLTSASGDGTIKIWATSSGECLQTLDLDSAVVSIAFSHDSTRLVSGSADSLVKVWDTKRNECLQTFEGHGGVVRSVTFSHDSTWLASASDDSTVKIWDVSSSSRHLQTLEGHSAEVTSVAFSYDSTWLASASRDGMVKIWDVSSGKCLRTLKGHGRWVVSIAISHDSTRLVSASSTIKIWDTSSGECLQTLEGHSRIIWSVAFSHDSTQLVSSSDDTTVKIWDTGTGDCLQTLEGHSADVTSAAFSHDSTWLASASDDRTVKIWDMNSYQCLQTLEGHSSEVKSIAFSHDSTRLASASVDRTVKIWNTNSGECLQTLGISKVLTNISFDTTGSYLHTEIGAINIEAASASTIPLDATSSQNLQCQGWGLSLDGAWITYNSTNRVWLPSEYRPSCSAVLGTTIGIGVGSGKVLFIKLGIHEGVTVLVYFSVLSIPKAYLVYGYSAALHAQSKFAQGWNGTAGAAKKKVDQALGDRVSSGSWAALLMGSVVEPQNILLPFSGDFP